MASQQWPWHPEPCPFAIRWGLHADPRTSDKWAQKIPDANRRSLVKRVTELLVKQTGAECEFLEWAEILSAPHDTTTDGRGYAQNDGAHITVMLKHAGIKKAMTAHIYLGNGEFKTVQTTNFSALSRDRVTVITEPDGRYPNHVMHQKWSGWASWRPGMAPTLPQAPSQNTGGKGPGAGGAGGAGVGAGNAGSAGFGTAGGGVAGMPNLQSSKGTMPYSSSGVSDTVTGFTNSAVRSNIRYPRHDAYGSPQNWNRGKSQQSHPKMLKDIPHDISRMRISDGPGRYSNSKGPPRGYPNGIMEQPSNKFRRDFVPPMSDTRIHDPRKRQADSTPREQLRKSHWWN